MNVADAVNVGTTLAGVGVVLAAALVMLRTPLNGWGTPALNLLLLTDYLVLYGGLALTRYWLLA